MADKKTSQEVNGAPITKTDMFRIARIGNNFKLNSAEIFVDSMVLSDFNTLRSAGNLIAGRNYIITDGITPDGYLMVTAISNNAITNSGYWIDSVTGFSYQCNFDITSFLVSELVNDAGSVFKFPNSLFVNWQSGDQFNVSEFNDTVITSSNGTSTFASCYFLSSFINDIDGCQFNNCTFKNVTVNCNGYATTFENCHFENCEINIDDFGVLLTDLNINGNGIAYSFLKSQTNGTIVGGEFSTIVESIDMSTGSYNSTTRTLTLIGDADVIGIYKLKNFSNGARIEFIIGGNTHTPVKFVHDDTNGDRLNLDHSTTISGASNNQNILASHHGSNNHLDTKNSYAVAIRQVNGVGKSNFMFSEIVNYDA